jgi:hypothetical protein
MRRGGALIWVNEWAGKIRRTASTSRILDHLDAIGGESS